MSTSVRAAWCLTGPLDLAALERCVQEIVHERTGTAPPGQARGSTVIEHRVASTPDPVEAVRQTLDSEVWLDATWPRLTLIRLAGDDQVLVLQAHGGLLDDTSAGRFVEDLACRYAASLGAGSTASRTPRTRRPEAQQIEPALEYWRARLSGVPVLDLPADRPRPARPAFAVGRRELGAGPLARALDAFARERRVGPWVVLLAALDALLARYAEQDDVAVAVALESGAVFVSRADLSGDPTFADVVARVQQTIEEGGAHAEVPLERLLAALHDEGHLDVLPSVAFRLRGAPARPLEAAGIRITPLDLAEATGAFDLTLELWDWAEAPRLSLVYATELFESATVTRLGDHFRTLLEEALEHPESRLWALPLLSPSERRQILVTWNDTGAEFPERSRLEGLFERQVERDPAAPAVACGDSVVSYGELNRRANRLAHELRAAGVGPDVLVGVCVERSVEAVVGLLGIAKAGGAYVPVDPAYPQQRIEFMLHDAQVAVLLTQQRLAGRLPGGIARVVCLDSGPGGFPERSESNPEPVAVPTDLAYVIYTSGSTGNPKGAMLDHRGRVNNFCDFNRRYAIGPGDRLLALSSLSFDMSAYDVFGTLAAGAMLVIPEPAATLEPGDWARLVVREAVTVWHSVPALLELLVDHVEPRRDLHPRRLRLVLLGGDWVPLSLPGRVRALADGVQVVSMGGATECSMDSTIYDVGDVRPDWTSIPYGAPMANQLAYVLDGRRNPVPIGVPGELYLGGVGVGRGYLNRPELTAQRFLDDPFRPGGRMYRTGDRARWRADGNLELLGRMDFQVKVRGYRVELAEIEAAIRRHPAVKECVVVAGNDTSGEKCLTAYVVQDPNRPGGKEALRTWQQAQVGHWRDVYDAAYAGPEPPEPTFNVASWDSSYTGRPLPAEEMREWVDGTVARIQALSPRRVLEIGCGLGLLLFRIAPGCQAYLGTDISTVALDYVRRHSRRLGLTQVELAQRSAEDFAAVASGSFDTVVLNSIVLDFPGLDYLEEVLRGAVRAVGPGGTVFVGDVRSLHLQEALATSVQLHRAPPWLPVSELRQRVHSRMRLEEELLVDPEFFASLVERIPEIGHVQACLKQGRGQNELIGLRYDVTLHVGVEAPPFEGDTLDWDREVRSLDGLRGLLAARPREPVWVRRIPNARTLKQTRLVRLLGAAEPAETAEAVLTRSRQQAESEPGIDPEGVLALGRELAFDVSVRFSGSEEPDRFDAVLVRTATPGTTVLFPRLPGERSSGRELGNRPLEARLARRLAPELRRSVAEQLPDYMVPSRFVVLDALPLTPNGKIDRKGLPKPDTTRAEVPPEERPRGAVEQVVAAAWCEVLGLEGVGVHEDFFEVGGHSLKAVQIASRLGELLGAAVPLRMLLSHPTVAGVAARLGELPGATQAAELAVGVGRMSDEEVARALAARDTGGVRD